MNIQNCLINSIDNRVLRYGKKFWHAACLYWDRKAITNQKEEFMKRISLYLAAAILMTVLGLNSPALTQTAAENNPVQHGPNFMDEDGDGYNDNAPDTDGDGIPNGQDPDYTGAGKQNGAGFVDEDGDGLNDNAGQGRGTGGSRGGRAQGDRPQDGSGYRRGHGGGNTGGPGSGDCTGDGPKGLGRGRQ